MEYITKDNTIIFSPEFNKPLVPELLLNYKKIIFSNFTLNYILFEAYENNDTEKLPYIFSKFNQPLLNSLDKLISLTHLTFGYCFNRQLSNSLDKLKSLTHLTFGYYFNCQLSNSLDKLTLLTHLTLGCCFNQKDDLPFNIKSITIYCNNSYYTDFLPSSIEEIELGAYFNLELDNLPSSIKKISFNKESKYNKELNCLPCGLKILQLPVKYNYQIKNIPKGLKKLICDKN
jgi:hypothetical protein